MKKIYLLFAVVLFFVSGSAQVINFPDPVFKARLVSASTTNLYALDDQGQSIIIDTNNDDQIDVNEAALAYRLNIERTLQTDAITNLSGIENFVNLRVLYCQGNDLTQLNLQSLTHLEELNCGDNILTVLNIVGMTSLKKIELRGNQFQTIDFSGLSNLEWLNLTSNPLQNLDLMPLINLKAFSCHYSPLSSIDLSGLTNLTNVGCNFNDNLTNINISGCYNLVEILCYWNNLDTLQMDGCYNLKSIGCGDNNLGEVDLSSLINLEQFACADNHIAHLDLSHQPKLKDVYCPDNNMLTLNLKNGITELITNLTNNYNLEYICADETEIPTLISYLASSSILGCEVNSYCTFNPGGNYFTISGSNTFDGNSNGCDAGDNVFSNLLFKILDTTTAIQNRYISDYSGAYAIPFTLGSYTLTPIIENPAYYTVSPSNINTTFSADSNSLIQDFCISPNGNHPDMEISMLPIDLPRPGFNSNYKIIYKNKGTQTQSGTISFTFNDAVLDLINANPTVSAQAINALNWNFTDLQPFESREITLTLNANSPQEIPPVNGGDILNFTALINSSLADETPGDNTFALNQTVVNSFDPNDKTCLQGNTITPEMVGKDVHYLIRFENTGTANAENVVVKDMIDTTKFDVNSLIPIDGSHSFVTRISNNNKVEFIFENINLPFDDANNDGYVAFKIKTKPTLVVGDSFSNTASIYFDYNFPIITDPAVTTVALLANSDFAFENYFNIYPNPANDVLNIETKQTISVTSINIYNTLGQVVLVIPNAQQTQSVDVSSLKTGNYLMKVNSDKGSSSVKFVKM